MASPTRIRIFTGKRGAKESAEDFLDDVEFAAEQLTPGGHPEDKIFIRLFRQHLEDEALDFWLEMEQGPKSKWESVKSVFLGKFGNARSLDRRTVTSRVIFMAQGVKPTTEYVEEAKKLHRDLPDELSEVFAICFVKGLSHVSKEAAVSFSMSDGKVDFKRALEFVHSSYATEKPPVVGRGPVPKVSGYRAPPVPTSPYQQKRRLANPDVICYNCGEASHYARDCLLNTW